MQGKGGDDLATELSMALQRCLMGGKSGAGRLSKIVYKIFMCLVYYDWEIFYM